MSALVVESSRDKEFIQLISMIGSVCVTALMRLGKLFLVLCRGLLLSLRLKILQLKLELLHMNLQAKEALNLLVKARVH